MKIIAMVGTMDNAPETANIVLKVVPDKHNLGPQERYVVAMSMDKEEIIPLRDMISNFVRQYFGTAPSPWDEDPNGDTMEFSYPGLVRLVASHFVDALQLTIQTTCCSGLASRV